jgi:REP element-mobilizing transposase RayT
MNMAEKEEQHSSQELYQGTYRIKSARATWCNYNEGLYFITICTAGKRHFFGEIEDAEMLFTEIGKYAQYCISQIEQLHQNVIVPYFVVMPNHVHLIISVITDMPYTTGAVETSHCGVSTQLSSHCGVSTQQSSQCGVSTQQTPHCDVSTVDTKMQKIANHCGRLSHLITQFKSSVTKYAKKNAIEFAWQSRFHDHIIRNQDELKKISDYIQNNVYKWDSDCYK